jgi:hypothetical protein
MSEKYRGLTASHISTTIPVLRFSCILVGIFERKRIGRQSLAKEERFEDQSLLQ